MAVLKCISDVRHGEIRALEVFMRGHEILLDIMFLGNSHTGTA
jgi:hypothetical protein